MPTPYADTQPLAAITSLRLGGPPARLIEADSEEALVAAVRQADSDREPLLILGGASNVVVADAGFPGTVLLVRNRGIDFEPPQGAAPGDPVRVTAAAGETWDELVQICLSKGLAGIECLSGIPGSVGATPIQNVGAYGQEIADTLVAVRVFDRELDEVLELTPEQCQFGYRDSAFKRNPGRWVVVQVQFELDSSETSRPIQYAELAARLGCQVGDRVPLADVRENVLELRRGKGLLNEAGDPESATAGSFFTNPLLSEEEAEEFKQRAAQLTDLSADPPLFRQADGGYKTSAAWLIQNSGFRPGYGNPEGIAISSRHCLVLTNRGDGSTEELLDFAHEIAEGVRQRFGVSLHPEPTLIGVEW